MPLRPVAIMMDGVDQETVVRNRYRVGDAIGRGGQRDVYRAYDMETGEDVALLQYLFVDPVSFTRETDLLRRIDHPHVVGLRDAFVDDEDRGFLVMDLVEGENLAERVERQPFTYEEALPLFRVIADGLKAVHDAHVLHRDIKLENIVLGGAGASLSAAIVDFGISMHADDDKTSVGIVQIPAGTLAHMSREAVRGEALDARTDVYALGVCFYRMLTGALPVDTEGSTLEVLRRISDGVMIDFDRLPDLPNRFADLLQRMLDDRKTERPYMPEVVDVLGGLDTVMTPPARRPRRERLPCHAIIELDRKITPERVRLVAWPHAPLVLIHAGEPSVVEARTLDGGVGFSVEVPGEVDGLVVADLDGDRVPELYVFGRDRLSCVDASGTVRFTTWREQWAPSGGTAFAIQHRAFPRLVLDGYSYAADGSPLFPIDHVYEGNGTTLVPAPQGRGLSYNGLAHQAFRGSYGTPSAILSRPTQAEFMVAQLEVSEHRAVTPIHLTAYGPRGIRLFSELISRTSFETGGVDRVRRHVQGEDPLFGEAQAPLAVTRNNDHIVVVPWVGLPDELGSHVEAYAAPSGRRLWRRNCASKPGAGAILADIDGDGEAEVIVGRGDALSVIGVASGRVLGEYPIAGRPVAYGDPDGTGTGRLVVVANKHVSIWKGAGILPGRVMWSGPRGDQWRTGTLRADGVPVGPV